MNPVYLILIFGTLILIIAIITLFRQKNALIKRAQKIDPSVKNMAEADYVLKKDIAQSIGNNNQRK